MSFVPQKNRTEDELHCSGIAGGTPEGENDRSGCSAGHLLILNQNRKPPGPDDDMTGYLLLATALLITAAGQVLFKHYHVAKRPSSLILAVASFVVVVPITFVCVRILGLATVYVFMSINYGLVALAGNFFFGESMTRVQLVGIALVIAGCIIYNL